MKYKTFLLLFLIIVGFSSCKKSERFIMRIDAKKCLGYDFMVLSDKNGDVVAQSLLSENEDFLLSLPGEVNDRYDLTLGQIYDENFTLKTYRDIGTGFEFSEDCYLEKCLYDFYKKRSNQMNYELEILGVNNLAFIDFTSNIPREIIKKENSIIVKYKKYYTTNDVLLVRVDENSEMKSLCLNPRDNSWKKEDVYSKKININDFQGTIIHTLTIDKLRSEYLSVRAIDGFNHVVVSESSWSELDNLILPQIHKFYFPVDFKIERFLVDDYFNSEGVNIISIGLHQFYSEFPSHLDFYEPDINITFDDDEYDIEFDGYDKLIVRYFYKLADDNFSYSSWSVYQRANSEHSYCLLKIPKEIKKEFPLLNNFMDKLTTKKVGAFRAKELKIVENSKLISSIQCIDFSSKWVEK